MGQASVTASAVFGHRRERYSALLLASTVLVCLAWMAERLHLEGRIALFRYVTTAVLVLHAVQVIACFGLLITPQDVVRTQGSEAHEDDEHVNG